MYRLRFLGSTREIFMSLYYLDIIFWVLVYLASGKARNNSQCFPSKPVIMTLIMYSTGSAKHREMCWVHRPETPIREVCRGWQTCEWRNSGVEDKAASCHIAWPKGLAVNIITSECLPLFKFQQKVVPGTREGRLVALGKGVGENWPRVWTGLHGEFSKSLFPSSVWKPYQFMGWKLKPDELL